MRDTCYWPRCRLPHQLIYVVEGKRYGFCDKHWELVMSEDEAQMARARKKMGMPMPKYTPMEKPEPKLEPKPEPEPKPKAKATTTEDVEDFDAENFQKMLQNGEFNLD